MKKNFSYFPGYIKSRNNNIIDLVNTNLPLRKIAKQDINVGSKTKKTGTDGMIGAIISGVVGLASAIGSIFSARKARKAASKEAETQRQWQEKMYNESNQYNEPKQQLQRYNEAGLNPNLVFGQGGSSLAAQFGTGASAAGNVSTTPQYGDALKGISDAIMLYNNYKQTQSNIALQDEQIKTQRTQQKLNEAEAKNKDVSSESISIDNVFKLDRKGLVDLSMQLDNEVKQSVLGLNTEQRRLISANVGFVNEQIRKVDAEINKINKEADLTEQRRQEIIQNLQMAWKKLPLELGVMKATIREKMANAALAKARENLVVSQTMTEDSMRGANLDLVLAQAANAAKTGQSIDFDNILKSKDIDWYTVKAYAQIFKTYASAYNDIASGTGNLLKGAVPFM